MVADFRLYDNRPTICFLDEDIRSSAALKNATYVFRPDLPSASVGFDDLREGCVDRLFVRDRRQLSLRELWAAM